MRSIVARFRSPPAVFLLAAALALPAAQAAVELLNDPPGFDRSALREVDRRIAAFFRRHLLR